MNTVKMVNITAPANGARYRALPYHDVTRKGAPAIAYGLQEKLPGARTYRVVAWHGNALPWKTMADARAAVLTLNTMAQHGVKSSAVTAEAFAGTVDDIIAGLPGGVTGFMKTWGVEHIVRTVLGKYAPHIQLPANAAATAYAQTERLDGKGVPPQPTPTGAAA